MTRNAALLAYCTLVRDRMRLQAWDLEVSAESPDEDEVLLTISPNPARHFGRIRVGSFFEQDRREQRQTVVHELVHLIQADLWASLDSGPVSGALYRVGLTWVSETVRRELEVQADAVARLIAPTMPMPPRWPK